MTNHVLAAKDSLEKVIAKLPQEKPGFFSFVSGKKTSLRGHLETILQEINKGNLSQAATLLGTLKIKEGDKTNILANKITINTEQLKENHGYNKEEIKKIENDLYTWKSTIPKNILTPIVPTEIQQELINIGEHLAIHNAIKYNHLPTKHFKQQEISQLEQMNLLITEDIQFDLSNEDFKSDAEALRDFKRSVQIEGKVFRSFDEMYGPGNQPNLKNIIPYQTNEDIIDSIYSFTGENIILTNYIIHFGAQRLLSFPTNEFVAQTGITQKNLSLFGNASSSYNYSKDETGAIHVEVKAAIPCLYNPLAESDEVTIADANGKLTLQNPEIVEKEKMKVSFIPIGETTLKLKLSVDENNQLVREIEEFTVTLNTHELSLSPTATLSPTSTTTTTTTFST